MEDFISMKLIAWQININILITNQWIVKIDWKIAEFAPKVLKLLQLKKNAKNLLIFTITKIHRAGLDGKTTTKFYNSTPRTQNCCLNLASIMKINDLMD